MSDFTPGPWKLVGTNEHRVIARFDGPNGDEYHAEIASVMRGQSSGMTVEEGEANANLIAAAPTMRDALQAALGILEDARTLDDAQNAIPFLRDAMNVADGDDDE